MQALIASSAEEGDRWLACEPQRGEEACSDSQHERENNRECHDWCGDQGEEERCSVHTLVVPVDELRGEPAECNSHHASDDGEQRGFHYNCRNDCCLLYTSDAADE